MENDKWKISVLFYANRKRFLRTGKLGNSLRLGPPTRTPNTLINDYSNLIVDLLNSANGTYEPLNFSFQLI